MKSEFQGICPLCYKPVTANAESRKITSTDQSETYHAACLQEYVHAHADESTRTNSIGVSLLEHFKELVIGYDPKKREEWIVQNKNEWEFYGNAAKHTREDFRLPLKYVAEVMGISVARLKRFEAGEPVRDAKLLYQGYISALYIVDLERRLQTAQASINELEQQLETATDLLIEDEISKITYALLQQTTNEQAERDDQHEHS